MKLNYNKPDKSRDTKETAGTEIPCRGEGVRGRIFSVGEIYCCNIDVPHQATLVLKIQ